MANRLIPAVLSAIVLATAGGAAFAAAPKTDVQKQCKIEHATDKAAYEACVKAKTK